MAGPASSLFEMFSAIAGGVKRIEARLTGIEQTLGTLTRTSVSGTASNAATSSHTNDDNIWADTFNTAVMAAPAATVRPVQLQAWEEWTEEQIALDPFLLYKGSDRPRCLACRKTSQAHMDRARLTKKP
jgi:hypothetical protein